MNTPIKTVVEFIKTDSNALYNLVMTEPDLFAGIQEDIDSLIIMECRGVARNHFMTLADFMALCEEIDKDFENVDRYRLDKYFFQLINRTACERFKNKVLKSNNEFRTNVLFSELKNLAEENILHYINSLEV